MSTDKGEKNLLSRPERIRIQAALKKTAEISIFLKVAIYRVFVFIAAEFF